jgi:hypothetical protein
VQTISHSATMFAIKEAILFRLRDSLSAVWHSNCPICGVVGCLESGTPRTVAAGRSSPCPIPRTGKFR